MGFWDEYKEIGGDFIKADELQVLIENGIPVEVFDVIEDEGNKFGPRYVLKLRVPNPETGEEEERAKSFPMGTVESRDRMLTQMMEYLQREDAEPVKGKFDKAGRSILFRAA